MNSNKALGVAVAVPGLLLTCCLCPLALNSVVFLATAWSKNPVSIYDQVFSQRIGDIPAASYISAGQFVCSSGLALIMLVVGVALLFRALRSED
ncbi:MAG: hypothetical protein KKB13_09245 [Chloroflexi bacterium]|nr:hypothetical protein [Chloroflexota bacterium]